MKGLNLDTPRLFRDTPQPPALTESRSDKTDLSDIEDVTAQHYIPLSNIHDDDDKATSCIETHTHDRFAYSRHIGRMARLLSNRLANNVEAFSFQPHFSGLKGPQVTIMRRDMERALLQHQGSPQEIFHNAYFKPTDHKPCRKTMAFDWDVNINHHLDVYDSDENPLLRSDAIVTSRLHFGGYFMGTLGVRLPLYNNLTDEPDLRTLTRTDPIRQDELGFTLQGTGMENMMLSAFATPKPDTYLALHGGYLEEKFFGLGGEFLYRPYDSPFSFGAEIWGTYKRTPYLGDAFDFDTDNMQFSAMANAWYDWPLKPLSLGLSAGRFLDGDLGAEGIVLYRPAAGWRIEGFATFSNGEEQTLSGEDTSLSAGLRVTMPLGKLAALPANSRQTFNIEPFARDKGQRVHNPYPLYDLTDPWSTQNLYNQWDRLLE